MKLIAKRRLGAGVLLIGIVFLAYPLLQGSRSEAGESWPRFRGPNGSGIYEGHQFPEKIEDSDVLWRQTLGGFGHASPVIVNGSVFVASADRMSGEQILEAFDLKTGVASWSRRLPGKVFPKHEFNSFASSTPAVDEERVFYAWATPESLRLIALRQANGATLWEIDLGPFVSQHGFGASPIVHGELVILPNEQDGTSCVVAVDRRDGQMRWKTPRRSEKTAYSTPCVFFPENGQPQLILSSWGHGIAALDVATGRPLWELTVFHNRTVGSPLIAGDIVAASSGEGGIGREMFVVRLAKSGGNEEPEVLYEVKNSIPYVPTPVAYGDRVYLLYDRGVLSCLNLATGDVIWRQRLPGEYFSSPVIFGKKLYCLSRTGTVVTVAVDDRFQLLGTTELGEGSHATPAAADGIMVIRTFTRLLAVKAQELKSQ